jgi:hypothetical protein
LICSSYLAAISHTKPMAVIRYFGLSHFSFINFLFGAYSEWFGLDRVELGWVELGLVELS